MCVNEMKRTIGMMQQVSLNPQYLFDNEGRRSLVVLSMDEFENLIEDLYDLAVIAERRDENRVAFDAFEKKLKADGII